MPFLVESFDDAGEVVVAAGSDAYFGFVVFGQFDVSYWAFEFLDVGGFLASDGGHFCRVFFFCCNNLSINQIN